MAKARLIGGKFDGKEITLPTPGLDGWIRGIAYESDGKWFLEQYRWCDPKDGGDFMQLEYVTTEELTDFKQ